MFHKHYMKNTLFFFSVLKHLTPKGKKFFILLLYILILQHNFNPILTKFSKLRSVNLTQVKLAFMGHPKWVILSALVRSKV